MTQISHAVEQLNTNEVLKITPQGTSMFPFFLGGRDHVYVTKPSFPLKKGDIALFQRDNGIYVIHRVYKVCKQESKVLYYMLGDNQTWIEGPIQSNQIHAVVLQIVRKGKIIHCKTNLFYRFLMKCWMFIRPLRPFVLRLFSIISHYRKQRLQKQ